MDIIYRQPEWSILFVVAIALYVLYRYLYIHKKNLLHTFKAVFTSVPGGTSSIFFIQRVSCLVFAWILATVALMQPAMPRKTAQAVRQVEQTAFQEIVFLLDNSQSMATQDTSAKISRFSRAQELIELILEKIGGTPISLYTFSGDTALICPSTVDYLYFRMMLRDLIVNDTTTPGTQFDALANTLHALYSNKRKNLFIILSDGEETSRITNRNEELSIATHLVQSVGDVTSRFDTIGIGSLEGAAIPGITVDGKAVISKLHPVLLQQIAEKGKGHAFFESDQALPQIAKELYIDTVQGISPHYMQNTYSDLSAYPVMGALFFLALSLLIPERKKT